MYPLERAAKRVANCTGDEKINLFCEFEQLFNPYSNNPFSEQSADWQKMFAGMCGFLIATNVHLQER